MHYSWPGCRLLEEIDNLTHIRWCQIRDRNWKYQGEVPEQRGMCICLRVGFYSFATTGTLYRWIPWHLSTQHLPSHKIMTVFVKMCASLQLTQRHTCPLFFFKKKEKTARVARRMHPNPNRTQPVLSPTCQIHQATQKFHRYEERQDVPEIF